MYHTALKAIENCSLSTLGWLDPGCILEEPDLVGTCVLDSWKLSLKFFIQDYISLENWENPSMFILRIPLV